MGLLTRIKLRDWHELYDHAGDYECVVIDPHGERHSRRIPSAFVNLAHKALAGAPWSVATASVRLLNVAAQSGWPFTRGHKYQYYVQDVLLLLVARKQAIHRQAGRGYLYEVY